MPQMKKHDQAIEALRVIAILAVVLIHTTTKTLEVVEYDLVNFPFTLFLNQIARFAVPLFFALSGFVLELSYSNHENTLTYLKKRFGRIFIPYVFWSGIYYLFVYNQNQENFLKVLLTGNASYQLYFIPTLCIFYLLFPFLHKTYKYLSSKWVILVLFISQIGLLYHDYYLGRFAVHEPLRIALLGYFVFVLGMIAAHNKDKIMEMIKKGGFVLPVLTILSGLFVFWEGRSRYFLTYNIHTFYSQWRPSVLLFTILTGLFLYSLFNREKNQFKITRSLSKLSYLVFFIHVVVLETVWKIAGQNVSTILNKTMSGRLVFDLFFFLIVSVLSFFIALIIHQIPKLNKITAIFASFLTSFNSFGKT
jgi:probable poly-beta-1,6-N-acetyl-D-glucosamine export protein